MSGLGANSIEPPGHFAGPFGSKPLLGQGSQEKTWEYAKRKRIFRGGISWEHPVQDRVAHGKWMGTEFTVDQTGRVALKFNSGKLFSQTLSLAGAVNCYRQEWQPEHGFHRLKGGMLAITPLFLKDDNRIRGLLLLLGIALRALTLTEFVVRRGLASTGETLKGLYSGNTNRATDQPTAERLLKAFDDITLYRHESATKMWYEVTELSPLQRRILHLMQIPESVYAPPSALIDSG